MADSPPPGLRARGYRVLSFLRARVCWWGWDRPGVALLRLEMSRDVQEPCLLSLAVLRFFRFSFFSLIIQEGKKSECRKGDPVPESDLKARNLLFNIRYFFQEWLFSRPLSALSTSVFHSYLGLLFRAKSLLCYGQTVTFSLLCTVSKSIALAPLLVSAGRFVDKRTNYHGGRDPEIIIQELHRLLPH